MNQPEEQVTTNLTQDLRGHLLNGRYRLERPIASGGMAQVWEALDQNLSRRVAVKILHNHLASDPSFVQRFRTEALTAARLSHPAIVSVYDTVSENHLEAIVMELVHGTTMRAELDTHGPMKVPTALAIGVQVCEALSAAHQSGLVHRDIKPANILLSVDGRVLVTDFGIAKPSDGSDLTAAGSMIGTPKYLAPEQVVGKSVDSRADLYALGVVLYEAIAGVPPFLAENDTATALARLHHDAEPLRDLRPDVSPGVEALIAQAMRRNPDERFTTAAALRNALVGVATEPDNASPRRSPSLSPPALSTSTNTRVDASDTAHPTGTPIAAEPHPGAQVVAGPVDASKDDTFMDAAYMDEPEVTPRRRFRWLVVAVVFVLVGAIAALALRPNAGPSTDSSLISTVSVFDPPPGDGTEHDQEAERVVDGDPTTMWSSETYRDPVGLGGKGGVGLVVSLENSQDVKGINLNSPESGWSVQVYTVQGSAPSDLESWGSAVSSITDASSGLTALRFDPLIADHVLLWFTRLPESGAMKVLEVTVIAQ
ncbi:MAG: protein kinase [Acidimicrobiales bacterium]|nr:protein kinase [Acidimicrobiales bacterium]